MSKTISLKLKDIMIDPALVTRTDDPQEVSRIEEGIATGIQPDALLVTKVGTRYVLIGGHHRYGAWLRALGPDGRVECLLIDCADFKSMLLAATMDNRGNSNAYTRSERIALFKRLRKEGCSKQLARNALGITEERATLWEPLVRMEKTSEPSYQSHPRARSEPAVASAPVHDERATSPESPEFDERARRSESPIMPERAVVSESPGDAERAVDCESPVMRERANFREITFHVERLRKLLPSAWKDARAALEILADEIIKKMKETPK